MKIELADDLVNEQEKERLLQVLNIGESQWQSALESICAAALAEYKQMMLGNGLPTRADQVREHRLFHLIIHYYKDRIPTETEVSVAFQLTITESRGLIRNCLARFRFQLSPVETRTLLEVLRSANPENDGVETSDLYVVIHSDNVVDSLNRVVSAIGPTLAPITKKRDAARTYEVKRDTYTRLLDYLEQELVRSLNDRETEVAV